MSQPYEFITDYEWMLDQVENILWILQKGTPSFNVGDIDEREIQTIFDDIKNNIITIKEEENVMFSGEKLSVVL